MWQQTNEKSLGTTVLRTKQWSQRVSPGKSCAFNNKFYPEDRHIQFSEGKYLIRNYRSSFTYSCKTRCSYSIFMLTTSDHVWTLNSIINLAHSFLMSYALDSKTLQSFKLLNAHTVQTLKREVSVNGKYGKKYKKRKPNTHIHQDKTEPESLSAECLWKVTVIQQETSGTKS